MEDNNRVEEKGSAAEGRQSFSQDTWLVQAKEELGETAELKQESLAIIKEWMEQSDEVSGKLGIIPFSFKKKYETIF